MKASAYSTHADCNSQYSPDLLFFWRTPQREAQYEICTRAIDGQWGDLDTMTGYEKCLNETYKYSGGTDLAYDYAAIMKSCMFGIYGEELSDDPGEKEVLEEIDDQVEDETITKGPGWSEINLETYCPGYKEDKEAGSLKDEYTCVKDGDRYRLYRYQGSYYAEYLGSEPSLAYDCEDNSDSEVAWLFCPAANLMSTLIDTIINYLLVPMLQWRIFV